MVGVGVEVEVGVGVRVGVTVGHDTGHACAFAHAVRRPARRRVRAVDEGEQGGVKEARDRVAHHHDPPASQCPAGSVWSQELAAVGFPPGGLP